MTEPTSMARKPNIGAFINPEHSKLFQSDSTFCRNQNTVYSRQVLCIDTIILELWIQETTPTIEEAMSGSSLEEGEVITKVRSTGICGSDTHFCEFSFMGQNEAV